MPFAHPPVITMFIGGMFTIPSHGWFMALFYPLCGNVSLTNAENLSDFFSPPYNDLNAETMDLT